MTEHTENNTNNELDTHIIDDNFNMIQSEQGIIDRAKEHILSGTATEEDKLIVKLLNIGNFTTSVDRIFGNIQPLDIQDKNIKQSFIDLENAFVNTYNTIYKSCGNCPAYTFDNIIQYLSDVYIEKIEEKNTRPSRTFVLLELIRKEMESDKWYTIEEMWNIIDYQKYKEILKLGGMGLLLNACVQEGYFEEKRELSKIGKTLKRYFKKTEKEYLDFEEEKLNTMDYNYVASEQLVEIK